MTCRWHFYPWRWTPHDTTRHTTHLDGGQTVTPIRWWSKKCRRCGWQKATESVAIGRSVPPLIVLGSPLHDAERKAQEEVWSRTRCVVCKTVGFSLGGQTFEMVRLDYPTCRYAHRSCATLGRIFSDMRT